jgi:RNA polymerase sigma factor (sigma-70 family)
MGTTVIRPAPPEFKRPLAPTRLGRGVLSDEQLARMVNEGDPVAFSTVYERYRAPLSRYCRSILRQPDDAADAFQNTMMAALAGLERELPSGPLRPWLYRIAHNESIDLMRRRRTNVELVAEIPSHAETTTDSDVSDQLEALLTDLRVLPERQRGALLMRELAGLEYDQIGRSFDSSSVAARKLVYEARVTLGSMRDGRAASCEAICRQISDGDGRTLRNRLVRAHIDACEGCAAFERSLRSRREQLALVPALPLAGGGIWLASTLGGGAGATKALAGGAAVTGSAVAGGSAIGAGAGATAATGVVSTLGGAFAVKCLTVCGALALAGTGAALATHGTAHHTLRAARGAPLAAAAIPATVRSAAHPSAHLPAVTPSSSTRVAPVGHTAATAQPVVGTFATLRTATGLTSGAHGTPANGGQRATGTTHLHPGTSTAGTTGRVSQPTSGVSTTGSPATESSPGTSTSSSTPTATPTAPTGSSAAAPGAGSTPSRGTSAASASASSSTGSGPSPSRTSSTTLAGSVGQIIDGGMQAASSASGASATSLAGTIASALGAAASPPATGSGSTSSTGQTSTTSSTASPLSSLFAMFGR